MFPEQLQVAAGTSGGGVFVGGGGGAGGCGTGVEVAAMYGVTVGNGVLVG
jgi:hypothetical protein